jgi:hypothetical protein
MLCGIGRDMVEIMRVDLWFSIEREGGRERHDVCDVAQDGACEWFVVVLGW